MPTTSWYQRFDTPGIAVGERFDYWRTWYSEAVDTPMRLERVATDRRDFRSFAEVVTAGQVKIVEVCCGPALGVWDREGMADRDLLRFAIFYDAAGVTGKWHHNEYRLVNGTPALFGRTGGWWRAPYGYRAIFVTVPRGAVPVDGARLDRIADQQQLQRSPLLDAMVRPMLLGLVGRLALLSATAACDLAAAWLAALTMLARSLSDDHLDGVDLTAARLLSVRRFVIEHLAEPDLSPESVAAALGMSRRSLYRLVAANGEGVASFIRRMRLEYVRNALLDPAHRGRRVADIAAEAGLPDAGRFSRLFHATYGETPRELRIRSASTRGPADAAK